MTSREKSNLNLMRGNPNNPFKDPEKMSEIGKRGGIASGQAKREKKTLAQYLQMWMDSPLTEKDKQTIAQSGLEGVVHTKEALLVLPLLQNVLKKGDVKSYEYITKLLGQDKKREEEIEKLKRENEKLLLEQELLKQQLGNGGAEEVIISFDMKRQEDDSINE